MTKPSDIRSRQRIELVSKNVKNRTELLFTRGGDWVRTRCLPSTEVADVTVTSWFDKRARMSVNLQYGRGGRTVDHDNDRSNADDCKVNKNLFPSVRFRHTSSASYADGGKNNFVRGSRSSEEKKIALSATTCAEKMLAVPCDVGSSGPARLPVGFVVRRPHRGIMELGHGPARPASRPLRRVDVTHFITVLIVLPDLDEIAFFPLVPRKTSAGAARSLHRRRVCRANSRVAVQRENLIS